MRYVQATTRLKVIGKVECGLNPGLTGSVTSQNLNLWEGDCGVYLDRGGHADSLSELAGASHNRNDDSQGWQHSPVTHPLTRHQLFEDT